MVGLTVVSLLRLRSRDDCERQQGHVKEEALESYPFTAEISLLGTFSGASFWLSTC